MDSASLFWLDDLQSLIRMQSNGEDLLAPGRPNALDMIDFVGIPKVLREQSTFTGRRKCQRNVNFISIGPLNWTSGVMTC
jgi:hypothetical protein